MSSQSPKQTITVTTDTYGGRFIHVTAETTKLELIKTLIEESENTTPHAIFVVDVPLFARELIQAVNNFNMKFLNYRNDPPNLYLSYYYWCSNESDRVPEPPHTSSGAHLMLYRGKKSEREYLAVRENKVWGMPGGRSKPGESLWQTARREAEEEVKFETEADTNLEVIRFKSEIVADLYGHHQDISAIFALKVNETWVPNADGEEIEAWKWVTYEDVMEHRDNFRKSFVETVERIQKGKLPKARLSEDGKLMVAL